MNWIELSDVVMAIGLIAFVCFDIGVMVGRKQATTAREQRLASMRRHPSNHLRVAREQ